MAALPTKTSNNIISSQLEIPSYDIDLILDNITINDIEYGEIVDDLEWKESKVYDNKTHKNVVNDDVRTSTYCNGELDFNEEIKKIEKINDWISSNIIDVQHDMNPINLDTNEPDFYELCQNVKVLKYNEGDYFSAHTDNTYSYAIVIIMFPGYECEGGVLRITDEDGTVHEFLPSNEHVQFIAFRPSLLHEVTPVTSGTRIAIKINLDYGNINIANMLKKTSSKFDTSNIKVLVHNTAESDSYLNCRSEICDILPSDPSEFIKHKKYYIDELTKSVNEISKMNFVPYDFIYNFESICNMIDNEKHKDKPFAAIALANYYRTYDGFTELYPEDIDFINNINERYNGSYLINLCAEKFIDDYGENNDYYDTWSAFGVKMDFEDVEYTYVHKIISCKNAGKVEHTTRYNDECHIKGTIRNYTVLVVKK